MSNIRNLAQLSIERPERKTAPIVMNFLVVTNLRGYEFDSEKTTPPLRGASWYGIFVIVRCEGKIIKYTSFPTQHRAYGFFRNLSDELARLDGVKVVRSMRSKFTAEFNLKNESAGQTLNKLWKDLRSEA